MTAFNPVKSNSFELDTLGVALYTFWPLSLAIEEMGRDERQAYQTATNTSNINEPAENGYRADLCIK
jgi:hypothetical protein